MEEKRIFLIGKQMDDGQVFVANDEAEDACVDEEGNPSCMFFGEMKELENNFVKIYCTDCVCMQENTLKKIPSEKQINLILTLCKDKGYKYDLYNLTKGEAILIIHYLCYGGEKPSSFDQYIFK